MPATALSHRVRVLAAPGARHDEILTPAALDFVGRLTAASAGRRQALLRERRRQARRLADGIPLDFPVVTSAVRADPAWRVAGPAPGLEDRRVEIVGPPDRRTAVQALASGAQVWVADFEDGTSPTWANIVGGQLTLLDAAEGRLGHRLATTAVRPRGWHLEEEHLEYDGSPVPAALVDFGLYFFHCARRQTDAGHGPYFSLPKLENRYEARLWNDVFLLAQELLGLPGAPSAPPPSSRPSPPPSRWRRSCTSCANTAPGSARAAGTTCSASSRPSATVRTSCWRTGPR